MVDASLVTSVLGTARQPEPTAGRKCSMRKKVGPLPPCNAAARGAAETSVGTSRLTVKRLTVKSADSTAS